MGVPAAGAGLNAAAVWLLAADFSVSSTISHGELLKSSACRLVALIS